jgi:hypothetical protein
MQQTDVFSLHQHDTGFAYIGRTRLKAVSIRGSANAARLDIFDTTTAPVTGSYGQNNTTITVTSTNHNLANNQTIGLVFDDNAGTAPNSNNYVIRTTGANTFTVTSINSANIAAGSACRYAQRWLYTTELTAGDTYNNYQMFPGEGMLAQNGIYNYMANVVSLSVICG